MRLGPLTLIMLIACRDKPPPPAPPAPPPAPPQDGVVLVHSGTAPLQPLRYHLTRGMTTASELVYDLDVKTDGKPGPVPTLVVELETVVEDVRPDGTAKLRITVVGTAVRAPAASETAAAQLHSEAAAIQGVSISELLAPDGAVSDAQTTAAGTLPDAARAQLDTLIRGLSQAAARLPAEPVGLGASWRERRTLPEGGIRVVTETLYVLTARDGDALAYTSTGTSTAVPQTVVQDGTKVEVTDTHGHAEAAGTIDLARHAFELTSSSVFTTTMTIDAPSGTPGAGRSTLEIAMKLQVIAGHPGTAPPPGAAPSDAGPTSTDAGPASADAAAAPRASAPDAAPSAVPRDAAAQGAHSAP